MVINRVAIVVSFAKDGLTGFYFVKHPSLKDATHIFRVTRPLAANGKIGGNKDPQDFWIRFQGQKIPSFADYSSLHFYELSAEAFSNLTIFVCIGLPPKLFEKDFSIRIEVGPFCPPRIAN